MESTAYQDKIMRHLKVGDTHQAQVLFQKWCQVGGQDAETLHQQGITAFQLGQSDVAVEQLKQAITLQPQQAELYCNLGLVLASNNAYSQALPCYEKALALKPDFPVAHNNLGELLVLQNEPVMAEQAFRQACLYDPNFAQAWHNLAVLLFKCQREDEAHEAIHKAIDLQSTDSAILNTLGNFQCARGETVAAEQTFRLATQYSPHFLAPWMNLAKIYVQKQDFAMAGVLYERALDIAENDASVHVGIGVMKVMQNDYKAGIASYKKALSCNSMDFFAHRSLAIAYDELADWQQAIVHYKQALQVVEDDAVAKSNLGMVYLQQGDLKRGWPLYEYRLRTPDWGVKQYFPYNDTNKLGDTPLFVASEQGIGDAFFYGTCLSDLQNINKRLYVECDDRIESLMQRSFPELHWIPHSEKLKHIERLPKDTRQLPLGSVPLYVRESMDDFPASQAFLKPDPSLVKYWRSKLDKLPGEYRVGFAWDSTVHNRMRNKLYPALHEWQDLFDMPSLQFINLQYSAPDADVRAEQRISETFSKYQACITCFNGLDLYNDFENTAALISNLDYVISVGNLIPNLSGALGVATSVLAPNRGWWKMLGTSHFPWFPSLTVHKQRSAGDWSDCFREVRKLLREQFRGFSS